MDKDYPRTTAGEFQNIVESLGQKTFKKIVKQHLHHHMLFGRVSRKTILAHPKINFKSDWLLWSDNFFFLNAKSKHLR